MSRRVTPQGQCCLIACLLLAMGSPAYAQSAISADGVVESSSGGFKFPDGSVQMSASPGPGVGLVDGPHRRYVSTKGSDSNACTLAAPCRSFAAAILATDAGGEVVAIDSGDYGPFTVDKALTIEAAPGVYAGIAVSTGVGVHVNTTVATDAVILRGLTIYLSGGEDGVVVSSGEARIEDCTISGFTGDFSSVSCGTDGCQAVHTYAEVTIENSSLINNDTALWVDGGGAVARLNRTRVGLNGFFGVYVTCDATAVIRDSVISKNSAGINAGCSAPEVMIQDTLLAHNNTAVNATDSAVIRISGSTVVYNTTGLSQAGSSTILSRGDNTVEGNDTDTSGTIGSYSAR